MQIVVDVEKKVRDRVKKQMEKSQREYYLNEQIKADKLDQNIVARIEYIEGSNVLAEVQKALENAANGNEDPILDINAVTPGNVGWIQGRINDEWMRYLWECIEQSKCTNYLRQFIC